MPPGRGYYGKQFKTKSERRLTPFYLLAAVPVLAVFAWVGSMALGGGGDEPEQVAGDETQVVATPTPKATAVPVAPTRHPSGRAGGLDEGAGTLNPDAPKPPISEYLIAGGDRFAFPLSAHAGVEDYFGTERNDGEVHAGVDFSFGGMKDILVRSACEGVVTSTNTNESYGLHVFVDCGDGFETVYAWLQGLRVAQGNRVGKTTVIGTGEPDGFLHFEIRYHGSPLNPADFIQVPGREVIPWTPTPTPTPIPTPTETPVPIPTSRPNQPSGGGGSNPPPTPTPLPPTVTPTPTPTDTPTVTPTPTITPTPTWTPAPTKTPAPPPATPTPLPRSR